MHLLANGMYEITEDTRLYAELKAYDAGFQTLHDQLDELLQEALIPTSGFLWFRRKRIVIWFASQLLHGRRKKKTVMHAWCR